MSAGIIIGHSTMDLDCIGSMVLARYLFPDHLPVRSHFIHPSARNLLNLFSDTLDFAGPSELKGLDVGHIVVVDARTPERINEFTRCLADPSRASFEVFDHHPHTGNDIPGAVIHEKLFGSNTAQLCLELMSRGMSVPAEEATIALAGIYADTGNFTHENVAAEDFRAAEWLLSLGASLTLIRDLIAPLREKGQFTLFHEILNKLENRPVRGHPVKTCYLELEDDSQGLGLVVEQVFEVENAGTMFGFFFFRRKGKLLVIARSRNAEVNLSEVLTPFGGGGHRQAASATVKTEDGLFVSNRILDYLEVLLLPVVTARDLMTEDVVVINPDATLLDASMLMEATSHTGLPVVAGDGTLIGILTLRDIMTGRKAGRMQAGVEKFMSRKLITADPETTVHAVDELLFEHNIGHLPILENGRLAGIITRTDIINYKRGDRTRKHVVLYGLDTPVTV